MNASFVADVEEQRSRASVPDQVMPAFSRI
jgi:hypothetical protein